MEFRKHWIAFIHQAATGRRGTRIIFTPIGATIFGAFTGLFVIAAVLLDRFLHLPNVVASGAVLPLSIPSIAAGTAITAWSGFHFLKVKGTPVPFNPPPRVVKTGPYRYARNPMLTGVFLFLFGVGFFVNSVSLVYFFTPLFILLNIWELKKIEEPELVMRLGDEYLEYKKRTPMFIPGLKTLTRFLTHLFLKE